MKIMQQMDQVLTSFPEVIKTPSDVTSVVILAGYAIDQLPVYATAATLIWMLIRIYETKTFQKLLPCNWKKEVPDTKEE